MLKLEDIKVGSIIEYKRDFEHYIGIILEKEIVTDDSFNLKLMWVDSAMFGEISENFEVKIDEEEYWTLLC